MLPAVAEKWHCSEIQVLEAAQRHRIPLAVSRASLVPPDGPIILYLRAYDVEHLLIDGKVLVSEGLIDPEKDPGDEENFGYLDDIQSSEPMRVTRENVFFFRKDLARLEAVLNSSSGELKAVPLGKEQPMREGDDAEPIDKQERRVGENRFQKIKGLRWDQIMIRFVNDEEVEISAGNITNRYKFSDLGFSDHRCSEPHPIAAWHTLRSVYAQRSQMRASKDHDRIISEKLRKFFGIRPPPIVKHGSRKKAIFTIEYKRKFEDMMDRGNRRVSPYSDPDNPFKRENDIADDFLKNSSSPTADPGDA